MISDVKTTVSRGLLLALSLLTALPIAAQKKDQTQKPMAGPRATPLRVTWLYITPDIGSQKVDKVQIGREMVVAEKSGPWIRVYANTDIEEEHQSDTPEFGSNETPPPISGWMQAKGVVIESTPNGDTVLMGEAANQETLASDPRGPVIAARTCSIAVWPRCFPIRRSLPRPLGARPTFSGRFRKPMPPPAPLPKKKKP